MKEEQINVHYDYEERSVINEKLSEKVYEETSQNMLHY